MNKKIRINHTLISSKTVYSGPELATLLGVTPATIRNWLKLGMKELDKHSNPHLIQGAHAREFIIQRKSNHKRPTKITEFYCPRCKAARNSIPEQTIAKLTGKSFKSSMQVIIYGKCSICGCPLRYFSSEKHLKILMDAGISVKEGANILMSNTTPSLNLSLKEK
jgi:hypothetical protein